MSGRAADGYLRQFRYAMEMSIWGRVAGSCKGWTRAGVNDLETEVEQRQVSDSGDIERCSRQVQRPKDECRCIRHFRPHYFVTLHRSRHRPPEILAAAWG
jgi:hypothetical protein